MFRPLNQKSVIREVGSLVYRHQTPRLRVQAMFFSVAALSLCAPMHALAQPELINYQAVARDAESGAELADREVYIVCKILADGPEGQIIYQEAHENVRTNRYGLFSIRIGGGYALSGRFEDLTWNEGTRYLEIDMDAGEGLETLGAMQLVSVPYALHAKTADMTDDADADPTNELIDDVHFDPETRVLTVSEAGNSHTVVIPGIEAGNASAIQNFSFNPETGALTILENDTPWSADMSWLTTDLDPNNELISSVQFDENELIIRILEGDITHNIDLSSLAPEGSLDNDPTNELITDVAFDEDSGVLSVTDPGSTFSVNLAALIDDADADPANELITNVNFEPSNNMIRIQEGGNNFFLDLTALSNAAGNDDDPTNELITAFEFDESSSTLSVTDSGQTFSVNLAALINDADSDPTNELLTGVNFNPTTSVLRIADAGAIYPIDLSSLIEDSDADSTNELQNLAEVLAHGASAGDAGGARIRNIGTPQDAQDAATKTFVENVPISGDLTGNAADAKVVALQGVTLSDAAPADGQVLKYSAAEEKWVPGNTSPAGASGPQYYAVDPADFTGTRKSGDDEYNMAIFEDDDRFVTISDENGADKIIAPLHLPHGAVLRDMDVAYYKFIMASNMVVTIERKNIYTGNTNTLGSWNSGGLTSPFGVQSERTDLSSVPLSQRTVDLSEYSYRMVVRFSINSNYDEPSDAQIRLYGARIRYGF